MRKNSGFEVQLGGYCNILGIKRGSEQRFKSCKKSHTGHILTLQLKELGGNIKSIFNSCYEV